MQYFHERIERVQNYECDYYIITSLCYNQIPTHNSPIDFWTFCLHSHVIFFRPHVRYTYILTCYFLSPSTDYTSVCNFTTVQVLFSYLPLSFLSFSVSVSVLDFYFIFIISGDYLLLLIVRRVITWVCSIMINNIIKSVPVYFGYEKIQPRLDNKDIQPYKSVKSHKWKRL